MIKLTGNVSRKVPIPGQDYSSQSFSAGMEAEVGNEATADEIRQKIKDMYQILEASVKEQIVSNGIHLPEDKESAPARTEGRTNGGNGDITPNQKKLLEKLVREQQIFGKERISLLAIKSKSEATVAIQDLIDNSKKGGGEKHGK
jgi:hypothetical protein